jgi:hypothetical protein
MTYLIVPSASSISEGLALTTMVHTMGVANGTVLYWSISGANIDASDFSNGALSGQNTVVVDASGMGCSRSPMF